jgi:5'-methylthioadenosine phosphorylase
MDGVRVLARDLWFDSPYGRTNNWKLLKFDGCAIAGGRSKPALRMQSQGNPRDRFDHSCHRRAFWVLVQAGVKRCWPVPPSAR